MSKYIAIIDLPDDSKCFGCDKLNIEFGYCRMTGLDIQKGFRRPSDCPLIPVDRVMDAMDSHKVVAPSGGFDNGIDMAVETVKAVLGVTE